METFLIIAAIIIMLVLQPCLSGLSGPTARWMGTQRENANQHLGFINLLVTGVQQMSHFTPFMEEFNQRKHPSLFPFQGGRGMYRSLQHTCCSSLTLENHTDHN